MKTKLISFVVSIALACVYVACQKSRSIRPIAPGALPSTVLQPFLDNRLSRVLAPLDAPGLKHPEAVADLRGSITDAMNKAPAAQRDAFQAALAVCDVLSQAVDERQRYLASYQGSQRLSHYKDVKRAPLKHMPPELKDAQTNAYYANLAQNNAFNTQAYYTQWLQRSAELRQQIEQLYTRERETEAQLKQSPGS